jgi:hypothetical protein
MHSYQLRRYLVQPTEMDTWLEEWRRDIVPLRERFGFNIVGAWVSREENRFVWVMSYDGPEGFEAANERYYASPARLAIQPDPTRHLVETETLLMESVFERR